MQKKKKRSFRSSLSPLAWLKMQLNLNIVHLIVVFPETYKIVLHVWCHRPSFSNKDVPHYVLVVLSFILARCDRMSIRHLLAFPKFHRHITYASFFSNSFSTTICPHEPSQISESLFVTQWLFRPTVASYNSTFGAHWTAPVRSWWPIETHWIIRLENEMTPYSLRCTETKSLQIVPCVSILVQLVFPFCASKLEDNWATVCHLWFAPLPVVHATEIKSVRHCPFAPRTTISTRPLAVWSTPRVAPAEPHPLQQNLDHRGFKWFRARFIDAFKDVSLDTMIFHESNKKKKWKKLWDLLFDNTHCCDTSELEKMSTFLCHGTVIVNNNGNHGFSPSPVSKFKPLWAAHRTNNKTSQREWDWGIDVKTSPTFVPTNWAPIFSPFVTTPAIIKTRIVNVRICQWFQIFRQDRPMFELFSLYEPLELLPAHEPMAILEASYFPSPLPSLPFPYPTLLGDDFLRLRFLTLPLHGVTWLKHLKLPPRGLADRFLSPKPDTRELIASTFMRPECPQTPDRLGLESTILNTNFASTYVTIYKKTSSNGREKIVLTIKCFWLSSSTKCPETNELYLILKICLWFLS